MKTLSWEEFEQKYKPIKNHMQKDASYDGCMFETYGEELDFVRACDNNKIWTLINCSDEESWLVTDYHWADRFGYFITTEPWEDQDIQVNDNEMCTVEEAIDYCISFGEEQFKIGLDRYNVGTYFNEHLDSTFDGEMTISRAKYTAISYYEDALSVNSDDFDDEIHDYYSQLK